MPTVSRLLIIAAPLLVLSSLSAHAAPKRMRLTIDVKVEGTESVIGTGADQTTGKFREGYTLVTYLEADGDLEQFNTKDPQYAQKMMGMAAGVHAKANAAQGKPAAKKMSQAEMQAYLQKKQSACGAKAHTYVDRTLTGTLADVGGAVPYSIKETVNYDNDATEFGHGEAFDGVSAQLRHAARTGHKTAALKLTRNQGAAIHTGKYSGQATVDLTWRFEDVK